MRRVAAPSTIHGRLGAARTSANGQRARATLVNETSTSLSEESRTSPLAMPREAIRANLCGAGLRSLDRDDARNALKLAHDAFQLGEVRA